VDDADSGVRRDAAEALGKLGEAQRSLDLAAGETALASVSAEEPVLLLIIPEL
jgi:HEAT repeat protein